MIVIADSGSTKADWKFLDGNREHTIHSMGFNPVFHSSNEISEGLQEAIDGSIPAEGPKEIYYYGTGCWDNRRKDVIRKALNEVFPAATVNVYHDLLGAARATCGTEPGISCIIGTGSNTCLYDGTDVVDNVTNLGYLCGDEGSGTHLGKKLIRHYFYREFPKDLVEPFEQYVGGGKGKILDNIYGEATPNVYLASFTRFMSAHKDHYFIQRILYRSFAEFIDRHVRKYEGHIKLPVHFIGSIAFIFQETLNLVLTERGMHSGTFIKQPIDSLVEFHRN